jgi:NitT/TauT family transport system permease protein
LALSFILLVSSSHRRASARLSDRLLGANGSYDAMYAVVLTVAFIGFAADRVYQVFQNRMLRWQVTAASR